MLASLFNRKSNFAGMLGRQGEIRIKHVQKLLFSSDLHPSGE